MVGTLTQKMVCVGGPSGAGKDTVVGEFLRQHPDYVRVPRCTTRAPRSNEIPGVDYIFFEGEEFSRLEKAGLIRGVDHYCGERYGIYLPVILEAFGAQQQIIGVFGICAVELRELFPVILVYLTAPVDILRQRLRQRGDPPDEVRQRLEAAEQQWQRGDPQRFDHIIANTGSVRQAVSQLYDRLVRDTIQV